MRDARFDLGKVANIQIQEYILHRLKSEGDFPVWRIAREEAALRRILAEASQGGGADNLLDLSLQAETCGRLFREPKVGDRSDVSHRLDALRSFLRVMVGDVEGERRMAAIEENMTPRKTRDWHQADHVGGGRPPSGRQVPRLAFFDDLLAIVERGAVEERGEHAQRDRALRSTVCFSPLRWSEIVVQHGSHGLEWEGLKWNPRDAVGPFGGLARVERRGRELWLPLHRRAADALAFLYATTRRVMDREPAGPVFRSLRRPYLPLQYSDAKDILDDAIRRTGLPQLSRRDLLAAYAFDLQEAHGYTFADLKKSLGLGDVNVARELLGTHEAWRLNERVDAAGGPIPGWEPKRPAE